MKLPFGKSAQTHVGIDSLSAYLDNQVTPAQRARVEEHLGGCASCRGELESLRRTVALLQAMPRVPVPRAFTLSEAQVGIRRPEARPGWQGGLLRGLGAVAAIALIAFITTTMLRRSAWTPSATVARVAPPTAAALQEAQPAAPAASAPAAPEAVEEPPKLAEEMVAPMAAEKAVAPAPTGTAPDAFRAKAGPAPATSQPQAAPAPAAQPTVEEPRATPAQSQPTAAPAQDMVAAAPPPAAATSAPAPALLAAAAAPAAPAALAAPEPAAMAMGSGGEGVAAAEVPAEAMTAEPTPALARGGSVLPGKAGIAYADGHGLWTFDAAAGARQVLQREGVNSPLISSDRSWIAYRVTNGDTSDLWAVRWDGQDARSLLTEHELPKDGLDGQYTERRIQEARWVPRQNVLAITTVAIPAPSAVSALPKFDLWHLDARTGQLMQVADLARFVRPVYSPDGTQLAVLQYGTDADPQGTLALFKSDGTGGRVALRFPAIATAPSYDSQIQWLPDGRGLLAAVPDVGSIKSGQLNGLTLYRVPVTGEPQKVGYADAFQVIWAPDGTRMAYVRSVDDASGAGELYLANADGSSPQLYAPLTAGRFVNWSPDGSHFVYQSDYETYLGVPGQLPRRLGAEGSVIDPRWISAGQMLALHDTGTDWLVVLRGLDGNAVGVLPLSWDDSYDVTQP